MMKLNQIYSLAILIILVSCNSDDSLSPSDTADSKSELFSSVSGAAGANSPGNGQGNQSGLITAGEWNDLDNWSFWQGLLNEQDYSDNPGYWGFYTNNRLAIIVKEANNPVVNAKVELKRNGHLIWETKTDNLGKAELWIGLFQKQGAINLNAYTLLVDDQQIAISLKLIEDGANVIQINSAQKNLNIVELSFIVDATSSMSDELEFIKDDLENVIQRVKNDNPTLDILTATVFYRDEDDDYIVKHSDFTRDINSTLNFINQQSAGGGGDYPEAVHTALNTAITELQWSDVAKTRIAFLLLDAPPHYEPQIIDELHNLIQEATKKGIKIIPITASGIDKETEFLMRFFSISTNSTYVFITNDSGIGNDHLTPTVGEYEVEYLNDLIVRLVKKYSE
jgi:hypothetical protein